MCDLLCHLFMAWSLYSEKKEGHGESDYFLSMVVKELFLNISNMQNFLL